MSPREIEEGKTYHNGKTGKSRSVRHVIEIFQSRFDKMVRFNQVIGPMSGRYMNLHVDTFARWAKGEVEE